MKELLVPSPTVDNFEPVVPEDFNITNINSSIYIVRLFVYFWIILMIFTIPFSNDNQSKTC